MESEPVIKAGLCGKSYVHREKGKGVIKAQCGDRLLLCWPEHEPELKTLSQMMTERDMTVKYSSVKKQSAERAAPEPKTEIKVTIGARLKHKSFGSGVVLSVKNDTASILFSREHGTKRIVLSSSLRNGILIPE